MKALVLLLLSLTHAYSTQDLPSQAAAQVQEQRYDFTPGGPIADAELGQFYAELDCAIEDGPSGTLVLEFWPEKAPRTVRNFLRYCAEGLYDGLSFHRILREFMVQGGDPAGNGTGNGKYGVIPDEFSAEARFGHSYGVISMAHSGRPNTGSCQFFICTADTMGVFKLDGKYASFGKLAHGVGMLEAIANVPTTRSGTGEGSRPSKRVTIVAARVKRGTPPQREEVLRPQPNFANEPANVVVQQLLIGFAGTRTKAKRTKEEAQALAEDLYRRIQAGEDFEALLREHSDDAQRPATKEVGVYRLLNRGGFDSASERALLELEREAESRRKAIEEKFTRGELDGQAMSKEVETLRNEMSERALVHRWTPRGSVPSGLGDCAFGLGVGECKLVPHDPKTSPLGWHIVRRLQ